MEVFITLPAKKALRDIIDYYKLQGYSAYADKIRKAIISKSKSLSKNPNKGPKEELLISLEQGHRYLLVESHFKIIYFVEEIRIIVTDVFDTRQQPEKLLKRQ